MARFVAAFVSALASFMLFNSKTPAPSNANNSRLQTSQRHSSEESGMGDLKSNGDSASFPLAGKSLDLTMIAATRAADILVGEAWARFRARSAPGKTRARLEWGISHMADVGVFVASASVVMWAFFYCPERLPRSYNMWIGEAAQVDERLIEALRRMRRGEMVYGQETGQSELLQSMCKDFDLPPVLGDPAKTIPIPCELVHMGRGPSCEKHFILRFFKAFRFAITMDLPLQLLMRSKHMSTRALFRGVIDAARSSAFLASFISLFYCGVCLARTRLGPQMFSPKTVTPAMWDSGLCIASGCSLCGWSILLETERRRQEIAFFVAPKAAATFLPRRYMKKVNTYRLLLMGHKLTNRIVSMA